MSDSLIIATNEQRADGRKSQAVHWYRTPLPAAVLKELHERSDFWGGLQSVSHLAVLVATGGLALYSGGHWPIWITVLAVFAYGTVANFAANAVHELGHGTVFRTRWLNELFVRIYAFFGWQNFYFFGVSHVRHHQYTLHPPDDLEVVLPQKFTLGFFLRQLFFVPNAIPYVIQGTWRTAIGKFEGEWANTLFPANDPARSLAVRRWAWMLLIGHTLILAASVYFRLWLLPVLTSLSFVYGRWLHNALNATQHIGLQDNVPDFRFCCRTILVNPVFQFLYWHMNYHTEHHMYAAVPCYKLGKLHRAIRHELPPCPRGVVETWQQIAAIQKIQETNPQYQHMVQLPNAVRQTA